MSAILNSLNAHNLHIFQPILMILVSKFIVHRALSDKRHLSLRLLSPFKKFPALSLSYVVFIMLINVKMPTIVGILNL